MLAAAVALLLTATAATASAAERKGLPHVRITSSKTVATASSARGLVSFSFKTRRARKVLCSIDHRKPRRCASPQAYRKLGPGRHRFVVRARNKVGMRKASTTTRVKPGKTVQVQSPAPSPAPAPTASPAPTTTAAPAPAPTQAPSTVPGADGIGVATGGAIQNEPDALLNQDLDLLASASSDWVRIDINWAQIQNGGPTSYDWGPIDRVVKGATARGMKVLGVILYTPAWARPAGTGGTYAPDPARYAAFAKTAVEHYSALGVHAYEVWNEANIPNFWTPKPDVAAYTRLLTAAYPQIKAADPSATVLTAGTSPAPSDGTSISPVDFLKGIYANGGGDSFDAVGHHPYCAPAMPGDAQNWSAWYQMYGTSPSLRSVMTANGDANKQIWATEYGAPTNGPSGSFVSEQAQADMLARAAVLWRGYSWSGPLMWYAARDAGTSTASRENFYGFVRSDFSAKPAFAAFKAAAGP